MANWGAAVPIIVAIIGISGVVIPTFSTQIYNKPSLNIDIPNELENGTQIIELSNNGTVPATNLSLVLTANNKIINNITNLLSTINVNLVSPGPPSLLEINHLKPINASVVTLHVDKFVSGIGSVIKLAVGAKGVTYKDYTVYMAYDQGSNKRSGGEQGPFFLYTYPIYFVVYPFIAFGIAFGILILYLAVKVRTQIKKRLCTMIMEDIIDFRKIVKKNKNYNLSHLNVYIPGRKVFMKRAWKLKAVRKVLGVLDKFIPRPLLRSWAKEGKGITLAQLIRGAEDFLPVDDFYLKMKVRKNAIKSHKDDEIKKLNEECLNLAEDALKNVNWSKYR
jgi:hypothetical protein